MPSLKRWPPARLSLAALVLLVVAQQSVAAPSFPELSGRVVDKAQLLSNSAEDTLSQQLEAHEKLTSNQVVVVTLNSLGGYAIDDYGYQLGRHWQLGQKDKDNGALLIVAKAERKVRIEVGYGLEGTLTDAFAHRIIQQDILPHFRHGRFEQGILLGACNMLLAIEGEYQPSTNNNTSSTNASDKIVPLVFMSVFISQLFSRRLRNKPKRRRAAAWGFGAATGILSALIGAPFAMALVAAAASTVLVTLFLTPGVSNGGFRGGGGGFGGGSGGFGGGGFGGGGFGGGGGSFGGGGASGGW
ncbi:TPM domain-containing protein [bacterium]|nr:TPM domain-containing protein [bacterium]